MDVTDVETRLQLAVKAVSTGEMPSARKAAIAFNVSHSTLSRRINKTTKPRSEAHVSEQRLTPSEEEALVGVGLQLNEWGWPLTIDALEAVAIKFLKDKHDNNPLGRNWYKNFLKRHPEIKLKKSPCLDQRRKDGTNYTIIKEWFDLYSTIRLKYDIAEADIYNMDEKGIMKSIGNNAEVIISRRDKEAFSNHPGNRQWVSIIECIGMNGYLLPPFIIFQGQRIRESWIDNALSKEIRIRVSDHGWADQEAALSWLGHFDVNTKEHLRGKYRLLIVDGHTSHISYEFIKYCTDNDIVLACLPPHTTHVLQPLEVGIFSPLANAYKETISRRALFGTRTIDNRQFLLYYQESRACISQNIPGAWRGTGLLPYNPEKILEKYPRSITPPSRPSTVTFTDSHGREIRIIAQPGTELADLINSAVQERSTGS